MLEAVPSESEQRLSELSLQTEYRSDTDDLIRDFYFPCLQRSKLYQRAVGYFTSRGLSVAAQGITALIVGNGRMLLVASPMFDADDLEAIENGYFARDDVMTRSLLRQIESTPDSLVKDRLGYLSWLIAEGRLEVRIAIPQDENGRPCEGIYHEKIGLFFDAFENTVAFTGSPNETAGGLVHNFESTEVFCSWRDPEGRVTKKIGNFERLWSNGTSRLTVLPFPEAAREQLLRYRPSMQPVPEAPTWMPKVPQSRLFPSNLWEHQIEAIRAWEQNDRSGIMSMATGSGKTLTALVAAERCPSLTLIVVAVPRAGLVEQWRDEIAKHTELPRCVLAYESADLWQDSLFNKLRACRRRPEEGPVVVVGTMTSLAGAKFETVIRDADRTGNALLIVDEVHNVGAPTFRQLLRPEFNLRLGLSATPARHFDEEGTQAIHQYFGSIVFTYDMRRAIEDGHLCPYRYFVYPAFLDEAEYDEYTSLTQRITLLRNTPDSVLAYRTNNAMDGDSSDVEQLLFRRARILKKCGAKLGALEEALDKHPMRRGLIYCADNDQLNEVAALLRRRETLYLQYTANSSGQQRRAALQSLAAGHVPVIVAIDCLDEGVDVPSVDQAIIIASSSNKRQFIQRRGRILRRAAGKATATLIDVVALPPVSAGRDARRMLNGELARVKEMAELAVNKYDALRRVKECTEPYGVFLSELLSGEGDG